MELRRHEEKERREEVEERGPNGGDQERPQGERSHEEELYQQESS